MVKTDCEFSREDRCLQNGSTFKSVGEYYYYKNILWKWVDKGQFRTYLNFSQIHKIDNIDIKVITKIVQQQKDSASLIWSSNLWIVKLILFCLRSILTCDGTIFKTS